MGGREHHGSFPGLLRQSSQAPDFSSVPRSVRQRCGIKVSASPGACGGAAVALGLLRLVPQPRCLCPHVAFISPVSLRRALVIECTVYRTLFPRDQGTYTKTQTILF